MYECDESIGPAEKPIRVVIRFKQTVDLRGEGQNRRGDYLIGLLIAAGKVACHVFRNEIVDVVDKCYLLLEL